MPLPNNRPILPPNTSPSGRSIHPDVARIMDLPGGNEYLAGLGPPPPGVVDIPPPAPIVKVGYLGGKTRPNENFYQMVNRWASSQSPWQQNAANWYMNHPYQPPTPWSAKQGIPAVGQSVKTVWGKTPTPAAVAPAVTNTVTSGGTGGGYGFTIPGNVYNSAPIAPPPPPPQAQSTPYGNFGVPGLVYGGGSFTSRFR